MLAVLWVMSAWPQAPARVAERKALPLDGTSPTATHRLSLTLAYFRDGGWEPDAIASAIGPAARILAQCGVALERAELLRIDAPERSRYFSTPLSRELLRMVRLEKPAVMFVVGTLQRPAFDAEAIGRGNSRSRPELQDTVWIARGARDLEIVVAHELAHVLMDSGDHSEEPGNLMREDTGPENTRLTPAQCSRLLSAGEANGLLR